MNPEGAAFDTISAHWFLKTKNLLSLYNAINQRKKLRKAEYESGVQAGIELKLIQQID